jgi:hypothetical protein
MSADWFIDLLKPCISGISEKFAANGRVGRNDSEK